MKFTNKMELRLLVHLGKMWRNWRSWLEFQHARSMSESAAGVAYLCVKYARLLVLAAW
jgi:hypothetical protein